MFIVRCIQLLIHCVIRGLKAGSSGLWKLRPRFMSRKDISLSLLEKGPRFLPITSNLTCSQMALWLIQSSLLMVALDIQIILETFKLTVPQNGSH